MTDFYNDNDPIAAAWLRELIREGHIAEGTVDERPLQEIQGDELAGFQAVHLFAGIGGWAYALELAGWPADRPVWTGSCPCQPFSAAGKRKGQADERHLWPMFLRLIRKCHPPTIFGEQVASDDGYRWLARVRDDLEETGYAVGCADLPACCEGSPIIRHRLWFVASARLIAPRQLLGPGEEFGQGSPPQERRHEANGKPGRRGKSRGVGSAESGHGEVPVQRRGSQQACSESRGPSGTGGLDRAAGQRAEHSGETEPQGDGANDGIPGAAGSGVLGGTSGERIRAGRRAENDGPSGSVQGNNEGRQRLRSDAGDASASAGSLERTDRERRQAGAGAGAGAVKESFWSSYEVVSCLDGKSRRVESGTFPLATGIPARMGRLRGYGNSIVPQVAAKFIRAYLEAEKEG